MSLHPEDLRGMDDDIAARALAWRNVSAGRCWWRMWHEHDPNDAVDPDNRQTDLFDVCVCTLPEDHGNICGHGREWLCVDIDGRKYCLTLSRRTAKASRAR